MDPIRIEIPPGVVKRESLMASSGRYVASSNIRWVRGRAQKIGGNEQISTAAMLGTVRGMMGWSDGTLRQIIAAGTEFRLYAIPNDTWEPVDITPPVRSSALNAKFSVTNGSPTVNVNYAAHDASVGQYIEIDGPETFRGVTLDGVYQIQSIVDTNNFTITAAQNATSTGANSNIVTVSILLENGIANPGFAYGWGIGAWGASTWGTARSASIIQADFRKWSLQAFGKILLAAPNSGRLYEWDPTTTPTPRASEVTMSPGPSKMTGFFVTAERFIIAFGTDYAVAGTQDLLEVWSSAQGDYTDWDVTLTTGVNGGAPSKRQRLQRGKMVVAGADLGKLVSLLWTDAALYLMQYTGSSFVFNTRFVAENCGLIGPLAFVVVNGTAYWVSEGAFWQYGDSGLMKIPNSEDYAEWVFSQARNGYLSKTVASFDSRYAEVSFEFVVGTDSEPALQVVYNYEGKFWFSNARARTSAARLAGQDHPYLAGTDGYIYKHEIGLNDNGDSLDWSLESAPFEIANGGRWMSVDEVYLDAQRQVGDVTYTFTAYDQTPASYTILDSSTNIASPSEIVFNPRISGRQMAISMSGSGVDCDYRMGVPRAKISDGGER